MDNQGEITYAEIKEIIGKTGKRPSSSLNIYLMLEKQLISEFLALLVQLI